MNSPGSHGSSLIYSFSNLSWVNVGTNFAANLFRNVALGRKPIVIVGLAISAGVVLVKFVFKSPALKRDLSIKSFFRLFIKSTLPSKLAKLDANISESASSIPAPVSPLCYCPEEANPFDQGNALSGSPTVGPTSSLVDADLVREIVTSLLSRRNAVTSGDNATNRLYDEKLALYRLNQVREQKHERRMLLVEGEAGSGQSMAATALVQQESIRRPVIHVRLLDLVEQVQASAQGSSGGESKRTSIHESQFKLLHIKHNDSAFARSNESFYTGDLNSPSQIFVNPFVSKKENGSNCLTSPSGSSWSSQMSFTSPEVANENLSDIFRTTIVRAMGIPEYKLVAKLASGKNIEELDWLAHLKAALKHLSTLIPNPPLLVIEDLHVLFHPVYTMPPVWNLQPSFKLLPQQQYMPSDMFPQGDEYARANFISQRDVEPLLLFFLDLQQKRLLDIVATSSFFGDLEDTAAAKLQSLQKSNFSGPVVDILTFNRLDATSFDSLWEHTVHGLLRDGQSSDLSFEYLLLSENREKWLSLVSTDLDMVQLYLDSCQRAGEKKPTILEFLAIYQQHVTKFYQGSVLSKDAPHHDQLYWDSLQAFILEMIMKGGILSYSEVAAPDATALSPSPTATNAAHMSLSELARRRSLIKELAWWGVLTVHTFPHDSLNGSPATSSKSVQWNSKLIGSIFESWFNAVPLI